MARPDDDAPSPGASGPGDPGYEGQATVGDEGAWPPDTEREPPPEPPE